MKTLIHLLVASAVLFSGSLDAQAKTPQGKVKSSTSRSVQAKTAQKKPVAIDINKATAKELQSSLKGVGPVKAKAIVDYRAKNGAFKTTDDLLKVPGVGVATVAMNLASLELPLGKVDLKAAVRSVEDRANAAAKKARGKAVPAGAKGAETKKGKASGTSGGKTEKGKAKGKPKTEKPGKSKGAGGK